MHLQVMSMIFVTKFKSIRKTCVFKVWTMRSKVVFVIFVTKFNSIQTVQTVQIIQIVQIVKIVQIVSSENSFIGGFASRQCVDWLKMHRS